MFFRCLTRRPDWVQKCIIENWTCSRPREVDFCQVDDNLQSVYRCSLHLRSRCLFFFIRYVNTRLFIEDWAVIRQFICGCSFFLQKLYPRKYECVLAIHAFLIQSATWWECYRFVVCTNRSASESTYRENPLFTAVFDVSLLISQFVCFEILK